MGITFYCYHSTCTCSRYSYEPGVRGLSLGSKACEKLVGSWNLGRIDDLVSGFQAGETPIWMEMAMTIGWHFT